MARHVLRSREHKPKRARHWRVIRIIRVPLAMGGNQSSTQVVWKKHDALCPAMDEMLLLATQALRSELSNYEHLCAIEELVNSRIHDTSLFAYILQARHLGTWRVVEEVSYVFTRMTTPKVTRDSSEHQPREE